jgi:uncharacterized membrane protein
MTYDRDLQHARRVLSGLTLANLATALLNGWERYWTVVLASLIWALTCLFMIAFVETQQRTRDQERVTEAAIRGLMEQQEK